MTVIDTAIEWTAPYLGQSWATFLIYLVGAVACLLLVLAIAPLYVWGMRKIMARIQHRVGPTRVGPFGLLQVLADGIKMVAKEDVRPAAVDKFTWSLAVYVLLVPVLVLFLFIPWHQGVVVSDVTTGIVLVLALAAVSPVGEILAGWGSNNKYSMLGGIRAAALDVAYEVPLVISAAGVILLTALTGDATMQLDGIVQAQVDGIWFVFLQPLGFFIFIVAGLAKIGIAPIDLPEAESELVAGFHTEYSGMRFGMLFLTLFANIFLISALTVVLFLGGWHGPLFSGFWWFAAKIVIVSVFFFVTWFTLPRVRIDHFLNVGWKWLFPLSLLNLIIAALFVKVGVLSDIVATLGGII